MGKCKTIYRFLPVYILVLFCFLAMGIGVSYGVTTIAENSPISNRTCIIIDAGHGGVDGGASSATGVLESQINLEIALKLDDLMHLLGMNTKMIRTTDISVYTQGNSIAAKKVSDLKQRVKVVNETNNALLVSIHQNHFSDKKYSGAQVFYSDHPTSKKLAQKMQDAFIHSINPTSHRAAKKADGVYLMNHIKCVGILVECGFLSNPKEDALLRDHTYQNKICSVLAATICNFLDLGTFD